MTAMRYWYGTREADEFVFNTEETGNVVYAGRGADRITDPFDVTTDDEIHGNAGADHIISTGGHDMLFGGKGGDLFEITVATTQEGTNPLETGSDDWFGYNVVIQGGKGYDRVEIHDGAYSEMSGYGDHITIITRYGGTIDIHNVEEVVFV